MKQQGTCHIWPLLCQVSNDLLKASPACSSVLSDTTGDVTAGKDSVLVPLYLQFAFCHRPTVSHEATPLLKFGDLGDFASSF